MKPALGADVRKRAVNLTLNENLVAQARGMTGNLSGVVETLLSDYVENESRRRLTKARSVQVTIDIWNDFEAKRGSFADEYSTI